MLFFLTALLLILSAHRIFAAPVQRENWNQYTETKKLTIEYHFVPKPPPEPPQRPHNAIGRVLTIEKDHPRVEKIIGKGSQCVRFVQSLGWKISGNARSWPVNAIKAGYVVDNIPKKGSVIVTNESSYGTNTGHVLLQITDPDKEGWVRIKESNYVHLTVTTGWININSRKIVSFIH